MEKPRIIKYVYNNFKLSFNSTKAISFNPKKVIKAKNHNYECKKCKRQFISAQFCRKHIEDEHKITDLEKIGNMIEGPGGAKVSFIAPNNPNLFLEHPVVKPKTVAWEDFKKYGIQNNFAQFDKGI